MKQSSLPFSSIFADEMRQYLELAESADKVTESYYYTFKRLDDFNIFKKIISFKSFCKGDYKIINIHRILPP